MNPSDSPSFSAGLWKEGREGATSLCYVGLDDAALDIVFRHHAAVGIRASLVCGTVEAKYSVPAERNWDLLAGRPDPELICALHQLDGRRSERGYFAPMDPLPDPDAFLYHLSDRADVIQGPRHDLPTPLPSGRAPADANLLMTQIESVVQKGQWVIYRIDATTLDAMGAAAHRNLLRQLGDQHARIWCAPIRDIALWCYATNATNAKKFKG